MQWRLLREVVHPAEQGGPSYRPATHYKMKSVAANRTVWGLRVHIDHVAFLAVIVTDHGDIIYSALEYTESFVLLSMITII